MPEGFLCIDKPEGPSSFAVCSQIRRYYKEKRIGHAGTLDPAASGILVIALGRSTRLLPYLPTEPKAYLFSVQFGKETDTGDHTGAVVKDQLPCPSLESINNAIPYFIGEIQQTPPMYSAVKIDGKRAYQYARRNETVALKSRTITIHSLFCTTYVPETGIATFEVTCSSGTYVRSLATDIAQKCGTVAHTISIRRTRTGTFILANATAPDALIAAPASALISTRQAFAQAQSYTTTAADTLLITTGRAITPTQTFPSETPVFLYTEQDELLAVAFSTDSGQLAPKRVFHPSEMTQ